MQYGKRKILILPSLIYYLCWIYGKSVDIHNSFWNSWCKLIFKTWNTVRKIGDLKKYFSIKKCKNWCSSIETIQIREQARTFTHLKQNTKKIPLITLFKAICHLPICKICRELTVWASEKLGASLGCSIFSLCAFYQLMAAIAPQA